MKMASIDLITKKKNKNKFARAGSFLSFFTVVLRNCNAVL